MADGSQTVRPFPGQGGTATGGGLVKKNYALHPLTVGQIETIRNELGLPTETAAVTEAVRFRAALAKRELTDVLTSLSVVDQLRRHHEAGARLLIEDRQGNRSYLMVVGL